MSRATSIRGKSYENSFKIGFKHQNSAVMLNGVFDPITGSTVYCTKSSDNKKRKIPAGDIDAAFVNTTVVKVVDLLPVESCLHDRAFQIAANSLNFFESTTTEGANLTNSQYIEKKIIFHKELKKGTFDIGPDRKSVV